MNTSFYIEKTFKNIVPKAFPNINWNGIYNDQYMLYWIFAAGEVEFFKGKQQNDTIRR
jgi:hypothetical protein